MDRWVRIAVATFGVGMFTQALASTGDFPTPWAGAANELAPVGEGRWRAVQMFLQFVPIIVLCQLALVAYTLNRHITADTKEFDRLEKKVDKVITLLREGKGT